MKKYLYDYIKNIDEIISSNNVTQDIIDEHLIKTSLGNNNICDNILFKFNLFYTLSYF